MRLLLDTCVLIDYFGRREPFFTDVVSLRVAAACGDVELWASAKSFTDVFYVLRRLGAPSADIQRAFAESASFLHIASIDGEDISAAAALAWDDFEDCLVSLAAVSVAADAIITRDVAGFESSRIPVATPAEWLADRREEGVLYAVLDVG